MPRDGIVCFSAPTKSVDIQFGASYIATGRSGVNALVEIGQPPYCSISLVQKFLADMNGMGQPRCFRTDNGGEFTSRSYTDYRDLPRIHTPLEAAA